MLVSRELKVSGVLLRLPERTEGLPVAHQEAQWRVQPRSMAHGRDDAAAEWRFPPQLEDSGENSNLETPECRVLGRLAHPFAHATSFSRRDADSYRTNQVRGQKKAGAPCQACSSAVCRICRETLCSPSFRRQG